MSTGCTCILITADVFSSAAHDIDENDLLSLGCSCAEIYDAQAS